MPDLSEELRRELERAGDAPLRLVDPETRREYVLVPAEQWRAPLSEPPAEVDLAIPEGIRLSKAAIRRALPELLASRWTRDKYVCYHRDERVGVSRDHMALLRACLRRGYPVEEFFITRIKLGAASDEIEEIDRTFVEFDEEPE